ncbi:hypothetical protein NQZ68_029549 [Dissostichus eleginoides]|nr:hypothetical protein NQZ68_029549 [Dissostichus eleginoides]
MSPQQKRTWSDPSFRDEIKLPSSLSGGVSPECFTFSRIQEALRAAPAVRCEAEDRRSTGGGTDRITGTETLKSPAEGTGETAGRLPIR